MKKIFVLKLVVAVGLIFLVNFQLVSQNAPTFLPGNDPKPEGKKWVLIENLSDEFNGESLDESKWKNTDPGRWMGRAPGIFKKDVASVSDGNLKLKVYQLSAPEVINNTTWTHAGGYIGSKNAAQVGTYFEARMKASKTFMSSTFWAINNRSDGKGCDVRVTELDIQECIGQITSTGSWAQNKFREMGSNTHSRNSVCAETPTGSQGNHIDLGGAAYDNYYIYAAWWKSATEILFFLDGKHIYTVTPPSNFNLPMYLRMVAETYDWNPVPANGGMNGTAEERTTSYDWVRTWKLEDLATSLNENPRENEIKVYPNPATNKIKVTGLNSGLHTISILNVSGSVVKEIQKENKSTLEEITVSELKSGLYFLVLQNNIEKEVKQFVIQ